MVVVFIASECTPIAKVGGLADVVGSLPKALEKLGIQVKVILPRYGVIDKKKYPQKKVSSGEVFFEDRLNRFSVYKTNLPDSSVEVFLIDNPLFSGSVYLSPDATPKGESEVKRFAFLSLASLEFLKIEAITPDVIHVHDWHTALIPRLVKAKFSDSNLIKAASVLTIHNLGERYQGIATGSFLNALDLDNSGTTHAGAGLRFLRRLNVFKTRKLNFLEQGILTADLVNTVSPQYAKEILTEDFGGKLVPILKAREDSLSGILNGIDNEFFNPEKDKNLHKTYSLGNWREGKSANKKALTERLRFDTANKFLIGMVTRLDDQKGLDLVLEVLPQVKDMGVQLAVLGKGDLSIEKKLGQFCQDNPDTLSCNFLFDAQLANLIYAGSDAFLMPSQFEPCGLGQMIAMRYGSVPIVRRVGGLADSVSSGETGFTFDDYSSQALLNAIRQASEAFKEKGKWSGIVENGMKKDFSWSKSAKEYVKLYKKAIEIRG